MYLPPIQNVEQITKDPMLLTIRPWWIILLGAAILYLVPAQAVLALPVLGEIVEWVALLIPSISRWVELSPFPYNTKLFAVFVWVMIPIQVYWLVTSVETKRFSQTSYLAKSKQQILFIRLFAFFCFFVFFGAFFFLAFNLAIVDTPPCSVCVNSSRWAQLFIGCMYSLATSMLISFFVATLPLVFKSISSKGNHHV